MKGYWRVVWQNETVRVGAIDPRKQTVELAQPVAHGIGNKYHRPAGSGQEIYWVMNLLEEVDRPGEWAIDFEDQRLYFYPPSPLGQADILISDMDQPVVRMDGARHVSLQGLTIAGSLSDGIRMTDCAHCSVRGCVVRNVAKYAVVVEGGSDNEVRSSDLYALGAGGVKLSGGDSSTAPRTRANHRVINNDIHHFGEIERVYAPGVNVGFDGGGGGSRKVDAVGMVVAHNAIHHCPHAGVLFNSFDNLFEYNEVFQFALVSNDMGAFYSYAHEGGIGFETFRYNFMHSSPEGEGIYYDNITNHPILVGNIACKLGPPTGKGRGYGFLVKNPTGQYVDIRNNIAVNCKVGYDIVLGAEYTLASNISARNQRDTNHLPADQPGIHAYAADPGFRNLEGLDLSVKPQSGPFREIPGFERIPFEKIGLFRDEYRTIVPDYRAEMAKWRADQTTTSDYGVLDRQQ